VLFISNQESSRLPPAKDGARFWHSMRVFGVVLFSAVPIYALYYYLRDRIGMSWSVGSLRLLEQILQQSGVYELTFNQTIDNPDQRISNDINTFTQSR